jgi:hypothetical protein
MSLKPCSKLNPHIYIYYIKDDCLIYDRSVSRSGLGPREAKERVTINEKRGYESFYTIGTLAKEPAFN